jgi:methylene-fatty-acyl-phospholipid synthase
VLGAAAVLSLERITYLWIWCQPEKFRSLGQWLWPNLVGRPVEGLQFLFYCFKITQCVVFIAWCWFFGGGRILPTELNGWALALGCLLLTIGQLLNASVFYRLGKKGVFYGNRFGYRVNWCYGFPFSFFEHPQYAGALMSIWGFFLIMRFPNADWYWLPALESVYYGLSAHLESAGKNTLTTQHDYPEAIPEGSACSDCTGSRSLAAGSE